MTELRLQIVGQCLIEVGAEQVTPDSSLLFGLLLVLGMEHHRDISRRELKEFLYPRSEPVEPSSHRLRQGLYRLRSIGAPLTFSKSGVRANAAEVFGAHTQLLSGGWELRQAHLGQSFEILPGYTPPAGTRLCQWLEVQRQQLHHAMRQQLVRDFDTARHRADWRHLEALARRTLELDALNESAILALAEAIARTGSKALAVSMLDAYRSELGESRAGLSLPAALLGKRIGSIRERSPASRRALVPMIGREPELASLLSQWQRVRSDGAHLVWLTGNKSVGKSRLAEEFATNAQLGSSMHLITLGMSPMDQDRPLSLFAGLANRLSSLPGAAGCDPASLQALGKLSGSISLPAAVNPENTNSTYSDIAVRNAICDLIACVCDERPVLVIVDDAQNLDEASAQLLDTMTGRVSDKRLMIVLCSAVDAPSQLQNHGTLHLDPLSTGAASELWRLLLAANEVRLPDPISQKWLDAAGGNAGHMEMLVQQAKQEPDQFLIPVDLITLLDRRLSQLSPNARYLLEAIVILDDAATTSSAEYLTGLSTYDLLIALQTLEGGDWILNTASGLRCRSGLIAERVRLTSASTVTSLMEAKAAGYFENEQSGERWSPLVAWRIASHWQRAGEPRRARVYQRACWQHSVSIGQPASACTAIKEALAATTEPSERGSLLDDLIGALQAAGDMRAVLPAVFERQAISNHVRDNPSRMASLAFDADEAGWRQRSNPAAHVLALQAHMESPLLNSRRRLRAARMLMMAAEGDLDGELAASVMKTCEGVLPEDALCELLQHHVSLIYHTVFGDATRALTIADTIEAEAGKLERSWYSLISQLNCAFARQLVGFAASDYASLERGFAQAIDASMNSVALTFSGYLASLLLDEGDLAGAQLWLRKSEQLSKAFDKLDLPPDYLGAEVDLSLLRGDVKKAIHYMEVMERCSFRYQSIRNRNELAIYRLRVQRHCGDRESSLDRVDELLRFHLIGRSFTRHDDHMEVLWTALNDAGDPEQASSLLSAYLLLYRRERRTCRYVLRHSTSRDPLWALLAPGADVHPPADARTRVPQSRQDTVL